MNTIVDSKLPVDKFHVFEREGLYILYNPRSMTFYRLPELIGQKLIDSQIGVIPEQTKITQLLSEESAAITYNPVENKKCDRLVLVSAQKCNLACKYCYADGGHYGRKSSGFMSESTALAAIRFIEKRFPEGLGTLQFFGGEPLLNIDLIETICRQVTENAIQKHVRPPMFAIVTNGTLIDKRSVDLFNKYRFVVTISLDGNRELNDSQRVFKRGSQSVHDCIVESIKYINKKRFFPLNVEVTVTPHHLRDFENNTERPSVLEYIHALGVDVVHIVPVAVPLGHQYSTCNSDRDVRTISNMFDTFARYSIRSIITDNPIHLQKLVDSLGRLFKRKRLANFCGAGITDFSVDISGDIYPCFMFVGQREYFMGNVHSMNSDIDDFENKRLSIASYTIDKYDGCSECWANGLCSNCIGSAYLINGAIDRPIPDFCEPQRVMLERLMVELSIVRGDRDKWAAVQARFK